MKTVFKKLATSVLLAAAFSGGAYADQLPTEGSHAVTLWWVVFNNPDACFGNPDPQANCTAVDVFGQAFVDSLAAGQPDPTLIAPNLSAEIGVLYAAGGVTSPSGQIRLTASLFQSEPLSLTGLPQGVDPMGFARGLENANAEIHLAVRDHGTPNFNDLLPQITQHTDQYCSDPVLGYVSGDNICSDQHFAVFGPGVSGAAPIYAFANPAAPLPRGGATLLRDGKGVRAVFETRMSR